MSNWKRRIRGAIGTGLSWGLAWFLVGMVMLLIVGFGAADVPFPLGFGFLGFWAGAAFSLVLGVAESGRTISQMSIPRFAFWGGASGVLFAVLFGTVAMLAGDPFMLGDATLLMTVFGIAGAASAGTSLAIARRGRDSLLSPGAEAAELTSPGEARRRLGA